MPNDCIEKHQLAGLDERARGFNRVVEIQRAGAACHAILQYEQTQVVADGHVTAADAVQVLIDRLHVQGYRQLRSQLSFRGTTYYGNREPWIEYPDPAEPVQLENLFARLVSWLHRGQITS